MAGNEYSPTPLLAVSRATPLASLTIVTVTPGIGLCASFTVPRRPPWADCADAAISALTRSANAITVHITEAKNVLILCFLQRKADTSSQTHERLAVEGIRLSVADKWQIVANPRTEDRSILKDGSPTRLIGKINRIDKSDWFLLAGRGQTV